MAAPASARASWHEERVDALLAAASELGLSMSHSAAAELINERVRLVATQMRVTPRAARPYLTEEVISRLAQAIAFDFVEESPGDDLFAAPRDSAIPVQLVGRAMAGLAEAVRIRLAERDDLEHSRVTVSQLVEAMFDSAFEQGEPLAMLSASEGSIYGHFGFSPAT